MAEIIVDEKILKTMESLLGSAERLKDSAEISSALLLKHISMLNIALDVMIAVSEDETAEERIRRRLAFALKQIRGIGIS